MELVVSLAIAGTVTVASSGTVYQIITNVQRNSHHVTAIMQVENSMQAIRQDVQRAQCIMTENLSSSELLVLSRIEPNGDSCNITYSYGDVAGYTWKNLLRNVSINGAADQVTVIGQNIDPEDSSCVFTEGILTFTVTAVVGGSATQHRETRTSQIRSRPG